MPLPSFIETLFPEDISYGSSGGPKFKTEIFVAASGDEQRSSLWADTRAEYNVSHGIRDREAADLVIALFYGVRGRACGFRYKDWADCKLNNELIGIGDGTTTKFYFRKTYDPGGGATPFVRQIFKTKATGDDAMTVNSVAVLPANFTINHNEGSVTFATAPANGHEVRATLGEFHVPVRFDIDQLPITQAAWETESIENIPLVEIKLRRA